MVISRDEHESSLAELSGSIGDPRGGILGPTSIAWRIGGDLAVFLGGGRAALLQLAHPMVAYAIEQHSRTRRDVVGRFQGTFRHVFAMVFGELDAAFAAARRVHAIHTRIHGVIPEAIGGWPAGTPYHANDADALRWVHATLVDSVLVVRELLGDPLSPAIKDSYIRDMNRFAALFGIPRTLLPADHAAHVSYMERELASDRLAVAPCARAMAAFLIGRGDAGQPKLGRVTEAVTAAMLPPRLVREFGLRASPRLVRAGLAAIAPPLRYLPRSLVAIPAHADASRRLEGRGPSRWAAWTERQLFSLARHATGT
ncbi:MAG: DUF2236 domain-containing protein [Deltaproteobacteria bacterium]|nr:DUF2236 domain-containing protein [Deltaproteobacteria bacterium]